MPRKQRWAGEDRKSFLQILKATGNVSAAARSAGVSLHNAYLKKNAEPRFSREWDSAIEEALDELEAEMRRRAMEGTVKEVYYGGEKIGTIKSYNDNLAMFMLKSRRGQIYGDAVVAPGTQTKKPFENPREKLMTKLQDMKSKTEPKPKTKPKTKPKK